MSDTKDLVVIPPPAHGMERREIRWILPVSLCFGSALGAVFFRFFPGYVPLDVLTGMVSEAHPQDATVWLMAAVSWPGVLTLVFSTSVLGIYAIPAIFLARGFSLALALTGLMASGAFPARAAALVFLSAVASTTALFLLGEGSYRSSMEIRGGSVRRSGGITGTQIVFALLLFFLCAVIRSTLIPAIFPLIYTEI